MDSEKLIFPRENPRTIGFPTSTASTTTTATANTKVMPNDPSQKPPPSVLDRFRALLKQRDEDLRGSAADDDLLPPRTEEIVQLYELLLSELTFNSKPIITDLTIIAGEQRDHGKGIADVICARILENIQHARGTSTLKVFAQKPAIGAIVRDEEPSEWRRKHYTEDNQNKFETSAAYKLSNGREHQGPRALIDAYGSDKRKTTSKDMPLQIERLDLKNMDQKVIPMSWQNTEEEEFDWEDMSPTLTERGRSNDFMPSSIPPFRGFKARPGFGTSRATPLEPDIRNSWSSQAQLPAADDSSIAADGAVHSIAFGHGSTSKISRFPSEINHNAVSRYPREPWNMPHHLPQSSQNILNSKGRGRNFRMPSLAGGISSGAEKIPPFIDKLPDDAQLGPVTVMSRMGSTTIDSINPDGRSVLLPSSMGLRPPVNVHNSGILPQHHNFPLQNHRSRYEFVNNKGPNKSFYKPEQQLDNFESKELSSAKLPQLPNQAAGLVPLQPRFLPNQDPRENFFPSEAPAVPPSLDRGFTSQGYNAAISSGLSNPAPLVELPLPKMGNSSLNLQSGGLPPLPPGPPPANAGPAGSAVSSQQPGSAFSGLISTLMAQGLISLTKPTVVQDSVGIEFNADLLKVRHESAINALYGDLQRQCTTCGLRFKCQEEHSSHMDWHVTKNRMSKSRKQKPSRKWFVSTTMWLSGAEALGADAAPGFLPAETVVEKKSDEELAVPADEDQNVCALCGEPFDDFYSDETEEWMYKGAVYLNAPDGLVAGMDRSQLGPIVHAKCRSESSVVSPEGFGQDEGGITEEGSQRKRLRTTYIVGACSTLALCQNPVHV
ncbi:polyadenylation and cleavage factor homolog 4 isoform X2 [Ziziphus jujuba]|uniref:Polyadenylation and cleavage factor homolog 4 isoform X2 n=1 Tax=Ziziphus jujuba TaxID=326968 RepID=A0ABM3IK76_ZIZJJ|nr:polyadenylation and cleavage factor homolog 4 isoform X2 [Ziziphus jujuba]